MTHSAMGLENIANVSNPKKKIRYFEIITLDQHLDQKRKKKASMLKNIKCFIFHT